MNFAHIPIRDYATLLAAELEKYDFGRRIEPQRRAAVSALANLSLYAQLEPRAPAARLIAFYKTLTSSTPRYWLPELISELRCTIVTDNSTFERNRIAAIRALVDLVMRLEDETFIATSELQ